MYTREVREGQDEAFIIHYKFTVLFDFLNHIFVLLNTKNTRLKQKISQTLIKNRNMRRCLL